METTRLSIDEWQKYKQLRLRALKEDAQAFGANYKTNMEYSDSEWKRRLNNALQDKTDWLIFAKEGSKLVGMIGAYLEKGSSDAVTIISLYVPYEERGKGISNKLMEDLLKDLSEKPFLKKAKLMVNKKQLAATNLYKKFGFEEVGVQQFKMGNGQLVDELIMERQLPYKT